VKIHPSCDRHRNLQMVPCTVKRGAGRTEGHICPVPGCGRGHDGRQYFDATKARLSTRVGVQTNRREAARAAILKTIEERRVTDGEKLL
jgi:hypothetical protein